MVQGTVWVDNVIASQLVTYDFSRVLLRMSRKRLIENALERVLPSKLRSKFDHIEDIWNLKEGGVFLHFTYHGDSAKEAARIIEQHVEDQKLRSYYNLRPIRAFQVKGKPFIEDLLGRRPTPELSVEFDGPDVSTEVLYRLFRVYGQILDIRRNPPVKDVRNSVRIQYRSVRGATAAKNCLYSKQVDNTRLVINYISSQRWQRTWAWATAHPRIMIPLLLGLIGLLSYTIFDPLRELLIQAKLTDAFSFQFVRRGLNRWISKYGDVANLMSPLGRASHSNAAHDDDSHSWDERVKGERQLEVFLKEIPDNCILVHGPKGSGKEQVVSKVLRKHKNKLVIHCDELADASDHLLLERFASQIGYFPVFAWLVAVSGMIDTTVTAATGAKAGLGTSAQLQIQNMLDTLTIVLGEVTARERQHAEANALLRHEEEVSAQGGAGDAPSSQALPEESATKTGATSGIPAVVSTRGGGTVVLDQDEPASGDQEPRFDVQYPVIVIDGFMSKEYGKQTYIYDALARWGATVSELGLAHVIFVSDNPASSKTLANKMGNRPLDIIRLDDASHDSALKFVRNRLTESHGAYTATELSEAVAGLGGRPTDLEQFVQKVQAGYAPMEALQELVRKAESELWKVGLANDALKEYGWDAIHFWRVIQLLQSASDPKQGIPYAKVRYDPVFNGDDAPLRAMERQSLISIALRDGRPAWILPGRPIHSGASANLLRDELLSAHMGVLTAKKLIKDQEAKIVKYEQELQVLTSILSGGGGGDAGKHLLGYGGRADLALRIEHLCSLLGKSSQKAAELTTQLTTFKAALK